MFAFPYNLKSYMHVVNWEHLFCFILNNGWYLTSPAFFGGNEPIQLAHRKKKEEVETMGAPQSRRFYGMIRCLSIWPAYIAEEGRTLGKIYGIK